MEEKQLQITAKDLDACLAKLMSEDIPPAPVEVFLPFMREWRQTVEGND
jgi:hypothetical protein